MNEAQAEMRKIAAEAEERSKRFAHVQAMFTTKEAAFGQRLSSAQERAQAAQDRCSIAEEKAALACEHQKAAELRTSELEEELKRIEQANVLLAAQVMSAK